MEWVIIDNIVPASKSASQTIDARNPYKCINDVASVNGMGWMERDGNPILPKGNIGFPSLSIRPIPLSVATS